MVGDFWGIHPHPSPPAAAPPSPVKGEGLGTLFGPKAVLTVSKPIFHAQDLTAGPVFSTLILYALPMLVSMLFQQAYNLADGWIAGTQIGATALGAVITCYPLTVFFIAIASGLSMGTSIYCSQRLGEKDICRVKSGITTSFFYGPSFSRHPGCGRADLSLGAGLAGRAPGGNGVYPAISAHLYCGNALFVSL